jgi:hypothetical protein
MGVAVGVGGVVGVGVGVDPVVVLPQALTISTNKNPMKTKKARFGKSMMYPPEKRKVTVKWMLL